MISIQKLTSGKLAAIRRIKALIQPYLWDSGYVTGPIGSSVPLRVWVPDHERFERPRFRLHGLVVDVCEGVHTDGLILDGMGGGLVTNDFIDLPLEDVLRVERWAIKQFPKHEPRHV